MPGRALKKADGRVLRGEATRERVLDAAECLFADHGFDAVSIRQIAQAAGVTLGVVGFHSGSKEELFNTILKRRVDALSRARRQRLDALRAAAAPPSLRALMSAYIEPYIDYATTGGPQWFAYARLIAHVAGGSRWYPQVRDLYDPLAREYIAEIAQLYPDTSRNRLAAAFVMSVAAMLSTVASTVRMEALAHADGKAEADSAERLRLYGETLIDFCVGGIEKAVARPRQAV